MLRESTGPQGLAAQALNSKQRHPHKRCSTKCLGTCRRSNCLQAGGLQVPPNSAPEPWWRLCSWTPAGRRAAARRRAAPYSRDVYDDLRKRGLAGARRTSSPRRCADGESQSVGKSRRQCCGGDRRLAPASRHGLEGVADKMSHVPPSIPGNARESCPGATGTTTRQILCLPGGLGAGAGPQACASPPSRKSCRRTCLSGSTTDSRIQQLACKRQAGESRTRSVPTRRAHPPRVSW